MSLTQLMLAISAACSRPLLQAVRRNIEHFPADFMFELTADEWLSLRSRIVTSKHGRGGRRYAPIAFTLLNPSQPASRPIGFITE
jgi:ORF6N domain-containing protein